MIYIKEVWRKSSLFYWNKIERNFLTYRFLKEMCFLKKKDFAPLRLCAIIILSALIVG